MKWSLRTLLFAIALIAIAFAWRQHHRNQLLNATQRLQDAGAEVMYHWQQPSITPSGFWVLPAYSFAPRRVQRTGPDGKTWVETVSSSLDSTTRMPVLTRTIGNGVGSEPTPGPLAWYRNHDITVAVVVVDETAIDESVVDAMVQLGGLKFVQIRRDKRYFRLQVCRSGPNQVSREQLKEELAKSDKPFAKGSAMISRRLPAVTIIDGVMQ